MSRDGDQLIGWVRAQSDETCSLILAARDEGTHLSLHQAYSPQVAFPPLTGEINKSLLAEKRWPSHLPWVS
jgi:hypothetical protein